jgi:hypothetical protein
LSLPAFNPQPPATDCFLRRMADPPRLNCLTSDRGTGIWFSVYGRSCFASISAVFFDRTAKSRTAAILSVSARYIRRQHSVILDWH